MVAVPKLNNKYLKPLGSRLKASHKLVFVDILDEPGTLPSECYPNVSKKVETSGGRMILGWQVWQTELIIEAEHHAVWEDPDGELWDITPKTYPDIQQIMFIEDENLVLGATQVDNVRINTSGNALIDDWIKVNEAMYSFNNQVKGRVCSGKYTCPKKMLTN